MANRRIVPSHTNWLEVWVADKLGMIETMNRNLQADLDAGYNPTGKCVTEQRQAIQDYTDDYNKMLETFCDLDDYEISKYCYFDLLRRGAITPDF